MSLIHEVSDLFEVRSGSASIHPSWNVIELKEVCEIQNGFAFKSSEFNSLEGVPLIRIRDILKHNPETLYRGEYNDSYIVSKGDLLIGMDGDFNHSLWNGPSALLNQRVCRVIPNEEILLTKFLYYGLGDYLKKINENTSSTTVKHLSSRSIGEIPFALPPFSEQQRIVARLDAIFGHLDVLKEKLDRIPELLKNFRQQVLTQAVTGDLTKEWREETLTRIDGPFEIPKNWAFKKLSELSKSLKYGSSSKSLNEGEVPVLRMGNLQNGEIDWTDLKYSVDKHEIEKYLLREGDVLFNRTNSPELVGKTSIFRGGRKVIYAGYLIKIETTQELDPEFLNYTLNSYYAKKWCLEVKTDGVSQSNINAKKLGSLLIPKPGIEEQQEIVKRVKALFDLSDIIESKYQSLKAMIEQLPKAVLEKAFRGELVDQDPNDEPLSVLLEKLNSNKAGVTKSNKPEKFEKKESFNNPQDNNEKPKKEKKEKLLGNSPPRKKVSSNKLKNKSSIMPKAGSKRVLEERLWDIFGNQRFSFEDISQNISSNYEELRRLLFDALDNENGFRGRRLVLQKSGKSLYFLFVKI